jgi:molybdate transport system substrate-binding protein
MRKLMVFVAVFTFAFGSFSGLAAQEATSGRLIVAAAANIASIKDQLASAFLEKSPGFGVDFVFGASGTLSTQIRNGAPYRIFMSADVDSPRKLYADGFADGAPRIYARGKLILLSVKPMDFSKGLEALRDPAVVQIAIANPEIAPYGLAAKESLVKAGLWDEIQPKLVTAQSIAQAVQFTLVSGIGFVNKSALFTKEIAAYDREGVNWIEIDDSWHAPIDQGFVILKGSGTDPATAAFADFLLSPEARAVFLKYGYSAP